MSDIVMQDHNELLKKLAWEVARNVLDHQRFIYKQIFKDAPSTYPISLRNGIYNEITSAIKCKNDNEIRDWIKSSEDHRKEMRRITRIKNKAEKARGNPEEIEKLLMELKNGH